VKPDLVTPEILENARVIWDYHQLRQKPIPGDAIVALGTNDTRVAVFAAELFRQGYGKLLVCTGGIAHQDDLLATPWQRPEAEVFADIAAQAGVPRERILLETEARNTAENLRFTRRLLESHQLRPDNLVIAVKPFMQRRTWATMAVVWPEMPATVASPEMTLEEYFTEDLTAEKIIHIMMGDLQRIWVYGRLGWSAAQDVPPQVMAAYERLKAAGFTKHLLAESA
jgi:uncharacterized SAM-binding protein YcdF (DUF218 family)